jgi:hypothetical protein
MLLKEIVAVSCENYTRHIVKARCKLCIKMYATHLLCQYVFKIVLELDILILNNSSLG